MNIQNIKNETIAKLTAKEIGALDLLNHGVMTYKGTLKKRAQGFKTVKVSESETHFVTETGWEAQFIKIVSTDEEEHYACRIWNGDAQKYEEYIAPLYGIRFLK